MSRLQLQSKSNDDNETISAYVQRCDKVFGLLCSIEPEVPNLQETEVEDQFDRFRIWAGNIAAHRGGRSGLDYRLRDASELRSLILDYLTDLEDSLTDALEIVRGEQIPWDVNDDQALSDTEPEFDTEVKQIIAQIKETITCLMRLSMTIRNPVPHDLIMESSDVEIPFQIFDVNHVHEKFPNAEEYLVARLGKSISQRRQTLKQWRDRHERLSRGHLPGTHEDSKLKSETNTVTVATTLRTQVRETSFSKSSFERVYDSDSNMTTTSYASTTNSSRNLRPPPVPAGAGDGLPFECYICFRLISVSTRHAWEQHVYRDLHPYVCTIEDCHMPNRLFDSRRKWSEHEMMMHRGPWRCLLGCGEVFLTRNIFAKHIKEIHQDAVGDSDLMDLVDSMICKDNIQHSVKCTLCLSTYKSFQQLQKHIGRHQQELALFALPSSVAEEASTDGAASDAGFNSEDGERYLKDYLDSDEFTNSTGHNNFVNTELGSPVDDLVTIENHDEPGDIGISWSGKHRQQAAQQLTERLGATAAVSKGQTYNKYPVDPRTPTHEAEVETHIEEESAKSKSDPDAANEGLKFEDALGRTFLLPWRIAQTWKGMEGLIKQTFQYVENIGPQVLDGRYDLLGPDDEIILPRLWETVVRPGWEVKMQVWPRSDPIEEAVAAEASISYESLEV